jgi:hypothetical protein
MQRVPVTLLNITQLTEIRVSVYTEAGSELVDPEKYADCIHWCVPGHVEPDPLRPPVLVANSHSQQQQRIQYTRWRDSINM